MKRREFIRNSTAFTLAGLALPLPSFSKDEKPIRLVVVGTGGRGTDLIRKLSTIEQAEIIGICDDYPPHLVRAQKAAGPQAKAFASYTKMLQQLQPQAVVIATPLYLHYEMCLEALEADCAIFCEKTMCYSPEQAVKLAKEVRKRKAVFQLGLQRRANPIYRQAAAMVETGMLGQITAIKCQWHRNNDWRRPVPVKKDSPKWEALERKLNWRLYLPYSRGLMTELASHQMDVVNWFLKTTPKRVMGSGGNDYWRDGREVFDNIFCIYDYELNGPDQKPYTLRASYSSIQSNAFEGASELIMGTKGSLFLTSQKGLFYKESTVDEVGWSQEGRVERDADIISAGKTLRLSNDPWAHRSKPYEIDSDSNDTRDQLISFLDCVQRNDVKTICDVEEGLKDSLTVLRGHEALHSGKPFIFSDK